MAITTLNGAASQKFEAVKVLTGVLGPGGVHLDKGQVVRIPVADAYTLISGGQAEKFSESAKDEAKK